MTTIEQLLVVSNTRRVVNFLAEMHRSTLIFRQVSQHVQLKNFVPSPFSYNAMEKLWKLTDYVVSLSWRRFVDKFEVVFNYELERRLLSREKTVSLSCKVMSGYFSHGFSKFDRRKVFFARFSTDVSRNSFI